MSHHPLALSFVRVSIREWHHCLGHASHPVISKVLLRNKLSANSNKLSSICLDCQMAKSHNLPFHYLAHVSNHRLDLIFSDVWGPALMGSTTGAKYYVSFLDDYSTFLWLFPLKFKYDVEHIFLQFQAYVEKHFERKIKSIQFDWGGEFHRLTTYFKNHGINHRMA